MADKMLVTQALDARVSLLLNPHAGDNRMPALSGSMVSTIFGFR